MKPTTIVVPTVKKTTFKIDANDVRVVIVLCLESDNEDQGTLCNFGLN